MSSNFAQKYLQRQNSSFVVLNIALNLPKQTVFNSDIYGLPETIFTSAMESDE